MWLEVEEQAIFWLCLFLFIESDIRYVLSEKHLFLLFIEVPGLHD